MRVCVWCGVVCECGVCGVMCVRMCVLWSVRVCVACAGCAVCGVVAVLRGDVVMCGVAWSRVARCGVLWRIVVWCVRERVRVCDRVCVGLCV